MVAERQPHGKGQAAALCARVRAVFGAELPMLPRRVQLRDIYFVWSAPEQWLACVPSVPASGVEPMLVQSLAGLASIVDQTYGRMVLRVAGGRVRDALAKGLAIDLHPRAFKTDDAAFTSVSHIGVHLWQVDDAPTYDLAVSRSLGLDFWHWLEASCAEYGLDFLPG